MTGIISYGVEWETPLLVVNTTHVYLREKVPYVLGNGNRNPKIQYSLEGYHPRSTLTQPDKEQNYLHAMANNCTMSLEFIFGVFKFNNNNNNAEFRSAMANFIRIIKYNLCTDQPYLEIAQADDTVQPYPIVAMVYDPKVETYTDCELKTSKPPGNGSGVRFANHCPITGNGQVTIGIDFISTYKLLAYMVNTPLMDPSMELSTKQNFRDSGFKMTSHFLYHVMKDPPTDPLVQVICFWMVYPIINIFRASQFEKKLDYFKMLLPLKGRSNFTCLVEQLSHDQKAMFEIWYNTNQAFLKKFFPRVSGYRFLQSYPALNISDKYIYSAEIKTEIQGMSDIAIHKDHISYVYNGHPHSNALTLHVVHGEFMVWYGQLSPMMAFREMDHSPLIFRGVGNPAFDSADVNEWYIKPSVPGTTYNVVEVRELDKFHQNHRNGTRMPRLNTDNLQENIMDVLTNLHTITTTYKGPLEISKEEYDQYVASYSRIDPKAVQTKIVNALNNAIEEYKNDMEKTERASKRRRIAQPEQYDDIVIGDPCELLREV